MFEQPDQLVENEQSEQPHTVAAYDLHSGGDEWGRAELGSLYEAANRYAELGHLVFPCVPGSKRPLTTHGFLDGTVVDSAPGCKHRIADRRLTRRRYRRAN